MTFTLRQVTQRAGGGEIVRTRTIEAASISIGRGADCDLQLADLAVGLRQAQMRQTGAGQVTVEANGNLSFEADGKFVSKSTLEVARRPHLIFGSHSLDLEAGERPGEIVITVARLDGAEGQAGAGETETFSPNAIGLNKRATAWVLASLIALLCLGLPIGAFFFNENVLIHADRQWTSGPLSRAHAFLEKDCKTCHQAAFVAVRDDACLTCHRAGQSAKTQQAMISQIHDWGGPRTPLPVSSHADAVRMLRAEPPPADLGGQVVRQFAIAFNHPDARCASCHREHLDADGQKSMPAKTPTTDRTSHSPVRDRPVLAMASNCADCHSAMKSRLPDTTLIDTPEWGRHPNFRPLIVVSPNGPQPTVRQIALSERPSEHSGLKFPHSLHLSATGGVARMGQVLGLRRGADGALGCAACHQPDASGQGFKPIEMTRDCSACHSLAYAKVGGTLQRLPHAHPDQVVAALSTYYGSGGGGRSGSSDPVALPRRVPGLASPVMGRSGPWQGSPAALEAAVRRTFSPGGACFDCHTVLPPSRPGSLAYGIAPVHLTDRYLPSGAFNHAIAAHRQDAAGRETCGNCHKAQSSDHAEDLLLPTIGQCAQCHGKTAPQAPQRASADCTECHGFHSPAAPKEREEPLPQTAALSRFEGG